MLGSLRAEGLRKVAEADRILEGLPERDGLPERLRLLELVGNDLDELLELLQLRGHDLQQLLKILDLHLLECLQLLKLLRQHLQIRCGERLAGERLVSEWLTAKLLTKLGENAHGSVDPGYPMGAPNPNVVPANWFITSPIDVVLMSSRRLNRSGPRLRGAGITCTRLRAVGALVRGPGVRLEVL